MPGIIERLLQQQRPGLWRSSTYGAYLPALAVSLWHSNFRFALAVLLANIFTAFQIWIRGSVQINASKYRAPEKGLELLLSGAFAFFLLIGAIILR